MSQGSVGWLGSAGYSLLQVIHAVTGGKQLGLKSSASSTELDYHDSQLTWWAVDVICCLGTHCWEQLHVTKLSTRWPGLHMLLEECSLVLKESVPRRSIPRDPGVEACKILRIQPWKSSSVTSAAVQIHSRVYTRAWIKEASWVGAS